MVDVPSTTSKFDLSMILWDLPDGSMHAALVYATDLFLRESMEAFMQHFNTIIASVTDNLLLNEITMLTPEEESQVMDCSHGLQFDYPPVTVVDMIQDSVDKFPTNTAIEFNGSKLSYSQMYLKAKSVAHRIAAEGTLYGYIILFITITNLFSQVQVQ